MLSSYSRRFALAAHTKLSLALQLFNLKNFLQPPPVTLFASKPCGHKRPHYLQGQFNARHARA
jgi:hypothetical protein